MSETIELGDLVLTRYIGPSRLEGNRIVRVDGGDPRRLEVWGGVDRHWKAADLAVEQVRELQAAIARLFPE